MTVQTVDKSEAGGSWITLMDYATKNGVSLSTLRRHIKAQKVTYKVEDGRYLLWDGDEMPSVQDRLSRLTVALNQAQEEIAELKTLIAFYEEQLPEDKFSN